MYFRVEIRAFNLAVFPHAGKKVDTQEIISKVGFHICRLDIYAEIQNIIISQIVY